jgi:HPt (histidine-containing phosphotransfer) domain-containing protein
VPREQAVALVSDLYEREIPAQLAELTAAALAEDRLQTMQLAHKLRGGSWQLGALGLAAACATLEAAAKNPARPALAGQAEQIRQIYNETWALLREQLRTLA